ncbi:phospholipase A [Capnocytophaga canis]|nr:phospholipase A [Capnocytophaga canis]
MNTKISNLALVLSLIISQMAISQEVNHQHRLDTILPIIEKIEYNRYGSALSKMFEIDDKDQQGIFRPSEYRPIYLIPFRWTDRMNRQPQNTNPLRGNPPYRDFQDVETKFQVSLKTKVWQDFLGSKGDIWVAFTQQAYWQVYNGELSRPFRELNYEPEVMYLIPLNLSAGGFKWRLTGLSLNHQSNGKEHLYSRSWNRIILMNAFEWGDFMFITRFWRRMSEKKNDNDNPDIIDYVGRAELNVFYMAKRHQILFLTRNNLNFKNNRGFGELTYVHSVGKGGLRLFAQVSTGYGDSLIEYNHKQNTIGVGIMLSSF